MVKQLPTAWRAFWGGVSWQSAHRRGRAVVLSVVTSIGSKVAGIAAQLLAYPIAIHALGHQQFSAFVMLSAILAWVNLSSVGIGPAMTAAISKASAAGRRDQETMFFSTALWMAVFFAALLLMVVVVALGSGMLSSGRILGISGADSDALAAILIASVLVAAGVVTSVTDGARAGYLEQFITNIWNGIGSLLSLAAMFAVAWLLPTLTGMCIAVYGTATVAKIGNMIFLTKVDRRHLVISPRMFHLGTAVVFLNSSAAFFLAQLATLFVMEAPTLIIGWSNSASEAVPFNVLLRLEMLLMNGLAMITMPLWPAITDAQTRGEYAWIRRAVWRVVVFALVYGIATGGTVFFWGGTITHLWLGKTIDVSAALQHRMGILLPLWLLVMAYYSFLIGLGRVWYAALALSVWSAVMLVLGVVWAPSTGGEGMALAMCIGSVLCLSILMPLSSWMMRGLGTTGAR